MWPAIRQAYEWVYQAAHLLANAQEHPVEALEQEYRQFLEMINHHQAQLGDLAGVITHFSQVTASYWDGLFQCYRVKDLPRTNNDLEQFFGTARHIERRVTGRKSASPTLVVRGSVRVVAAGISQLYPICAADLQLTDVSAWRALRQSLDFRHEGRRCLLRFRRDPLAYLSALEQSLLTPSLPP
jgi:hypothetical protein